MFKSAKEEADWYATPQGRLQTQRDVVAGLSQILKLCGRYTRLFED